MPSPSFLRTPCAAAPRQKGRRFLLAKRGGEKRLGRRGGRAEGGWHRQRRRRRGGRRQGEREEGDIGTKAETPKQETAGDDNPPPTSFLLSLSLSPRPPALYALSIVGCLRGGGGRCRRRHARQRKEGKGRGRRGRRRRRKSERGKEMGEGGGGERKSQRNHGPPRAPLPSDAAGRRVMRPCGHGAGGAAKMADSRGRGRARETEGAA